MPGIGIGISSYFKRPRASGITPPAPPFIIASTNISIVSSVSGLTYEQSEGPSTGSLMFRIWAEGLSPSSGNITVTPDTNFEVYDGTTWQSSPFTVAYTSGGVYTSMIYSIRLKAGLSENTYSGLVTLSGANASTWNITTSGEVTEGFEQETIDFMTATSIPQDSTIYFPSTPYEITGYQYWDYLNDFVLNMKGIGSINSTVNLWGKFKGLYPLIGGTAFTTKFNLINPNDSDAAFRMSWFGSITFDGAGVLGDGFNGYGNTHIEPDLQLLLNSTHMSAYYKQNTPNTGYLIGVVQAFANLYIRRSNDVQTLDNYANSFTSDFPLLGPANFAMISRTNNATIDNYIDGTIVQSTSPSQGLSNYEIAVLALMNNGSISSYNPDTTFRLFSIGTGLDSTEGNLFYLSVLDFQTKLNRQ